MAVFALNDIIRIRIATYTPSQAAINTMHYKVIAVAGTSSDTATAATTFDTALSTPYKNIMSDNARYRGLSVQRIFPGIVTVPDIVVASDGPGVVASDLLPGQVSGIGSWRTDLAGRKYRGRVYIPFPAESHNDVTGIPTAAYVTLLDTLLTALSVTRTVGGGGNTADLRCVLFHRSTNTSDQIVAQVARPRWATQKRRGNYGRTNPTPF